MCRILIQFKYGCYKQYSIIHQVFEIRISSHIMGKPRKEILGTVDNGGPDVSEWPGDRMSHRIFGD